MKSRCILLDREHLLTEHSIEFKPIQAIEFRITDKEQKEARPRIVNTRRSATFDQISQRRSMTPLKMEIKDENANSLLDADIKIKQENCVIECKEVGILAENIKSEIKDMVAPEASENTTKSPKKHELLLMEDKENCMPIQEQSSPSESEKAMNNGPEVSNTPPARSILTKQRDLLSKEPCKIVKFSSKEDLIHNFTPNTPSPNDCTPSMAARNNNNNNNNNEKRMIGGSSATTPAAKINSSKAVVTKTRTKSNIVVRRVFVGSKHD